VVPEPLEIAEPLVRFEVMRMPDSTAVGDYTESGQVVAVTYNGERGDFNLCMYADNVPAIAGGREAGAFPKKLGKPRLFVESDTVVGTLDHGSLRVASATMAYKQRDLDPARARAEITAPTYMLKILPGYDGEPRTCELVRSQITEITVKGAWTSPARLRLFAHALAPLADLPVLEVISGSHILTDLTLGGTEVVHDYLTDRSA
jgi:acetoacetate decarboxylase